MSSGKYFAEHAAQWDQMRAGFFPEAVRDKALALAGVRPGRTAADLGAGTGFVTQALLEAGLTVFAVDQSPAMLAELRAKLPAAAGRLTALVGEAGALPLPAASVDYVFANMFLHHVDDPALALAEMARILRPGGRLVLTDLDSHSHAFLLTEHQDRWPGFRREDVSAWLTAAGLEAVSVDCCGENCCADSACGCQRASVSIFAASARKPVLGIRPADADPVAAGLRARALWDAARPLLCAEAVLQAVAEALGVASPPHPPFVPRLATGFCSGLARSCGPCGAFSAGVMALGLGLGRDSGADDLDRCYGPVQDYREFFLERFGALDCRQLTGQDLGSVEGLAAYRAQGLKASLCGPLLEACTAQVLRLLAEQG